MKIKWPSNHTLVGVAGFFGMTVGCTGLYMHSQIQKNFKQTTFVRESMNKLRSHEAAKYLLGTPIKDFNIHFHDTENNHYTDDEAVYKIPVKGPDGHGWFYIRAEPRGEGGKWVGVRLDLQLEETKHLEKENFQDKRLVIFDCNKNGPMILKSD